MTPDKRVQGLSRLLSVTAQAADKLLEPENWDPPLGSQGYAEIHNAEIGQTAPWGEEPVRLVYRVATTYILAAMEYAQSGVALLNFSSSPLTVEVLARASLEASSIAYWLLEDGLDAKKRVCRLQLIRRNSAVNIENAVKEMNVVNTGGQYGETVAEVEDYSRFLAITQFKRLGKGSKLWICETEKQLGYTSRVKRLLDDWGYQGVYNIYSGMAHAELSFMRQLLKEFRSDVSSHRTYSHFGENPAALHIAVRMLLLGIIAPLDRARRLLGWDASQDGPGEILDGVIHGLDESMAQLQP